MRESLRHIEERTPLARSMLLDEIAQRPVFINRAPVLHRFGIMAFRPKLVGGDVVQFSPLIYKGFGADNDGDAVQFHVPAMAEAVKEAYERMLPSRNLLAASDFRNPMHMPGQEYVAGTNVLSTAKTKRPVRMFATSKDAIAAQKRGELEPGDEVEVLS
jgi:DNA-directed RNA polymerase subunit beta'